MAQPNEDEQRLKEQRDLLNRELADAIGGELGRLAKEAGLDLRQLATEALKQERDILKAADPSWQTLREARNAERRFRVRPQPGESPIRYAFRLVELASNSTFLLAALLLWVLGLGGLGLGLWSLIASDGSVFDSLPVAGFFAVLVVVAWWLSRWGRHTSATAVAQERVLAAVENYRAELRGAGVDPWLRTQINAAKSRSYETKLAYGDRSGLAEVDDPTHEVPTRTKDRLLSLMGDRRMPGGAIGLAGSRGAGKSTLMRSICREAQGGKDMLGAVVEAPVEYDAREFVLHLFAKVCGQVVGPEKVAELRGRNRPFARSDSLAARYVSNPGALLGSVLALSGVVVIYGYLLDISAQDVSPIVWGAILASAGYGLFAVSMARAGSDLRRSRAAEALLSRSSHDPADVQTAMTYLRQIWFQQSFSSGWSGSFKAPVGLEAGVSGSNELAERQMSFPDVVDLFRQFLVQVSSHRQVRIGIDELDKMDDLTARRFLNEIKVIFRVPGCFFLISISEDAMSFFERRGLPFRDVFDSSLDQVVGVPNLSLEGSKALLDRRIVGLPIAFVCLLHCMSGGLPRDLIRIARDLVDRDEGTELDQVAQELVGAALKSKLTAGRIAARRFHFERHVSLLVDWLERLSATGVDANALLAACGDFGADFVAPIDRLPETDDLVEERRELRALGKQLTAFAYLAATLLQFMGRFDEPGYVDVATGADAGDEMRPSPVDRLAEITQSFSGDIDTVWRKLSRLRRDLGMDAVEPPAFGSARSQAESNRQEPDGRPTLRDLFAGVLPGSSR